MILPVVSVTDRKLMADRFSRAAGTYDRYAEHHRLIAVELLEMIQSIECRRVLELGCGTGILSSGMRRLFPKSQMVLTDSAPGMVSECRNRVNPSSLVRHTIWDFERAECSSIYDLIVSSCALQWLTDPVAFGVKLFNMVSPGGFTVHAIPVKGMLREFEDSFYLTGGQWPSLRYISSRRWDSILHNSGFTVIESSTKTFSVKYSSPTDALRAVRGIGATLSGHDGVPKLRPGFLRSALNFYGETYRDEKGRVPVSYKIHFVKAARL